MALPSIMRKLFRNDGYGPLLKPEIIPFASSLASDGAEAATTEWVKDIGEAPIYIDSGASVSGDGFSSSSPVKSFAEALAIANATPSGSVARSFIVAANTTYNEDIIVSSSDFRFFLQGTLTINGRIGIIHSASLFVYGGSIIINASSIYSALGVSVNSYFYSEYPCFVNQNSTGNCVTVEQFATAKFNNNLTIIGRGSSVLAISVNTGSTAVFDGTVGISVEGSGKFRTGVGLWNGCTALFLNGLWVNEGVASGDGVSIANNSSCACIGGTLAVYSGPNATAAVDVVNSSSLLLDSGLNNASFMNNGGGSSLLVKCSSAVVSLTTGMLYFGPNTANCQAAVCACDASSIAFMNSGSIEAVGTYSSTAWCFDASSIYWDPQKTTSSRPTGNKYRVRTGSVINTAGAAGGNIPGSLDGNVDTPVTFKDANGTNRVISMKYACIY